MTSPEPRHAQWMGLALAEARKALGTEDVPIGAVVIGPEGDVLGTGRNEREAHGDPTAHAEMVAIREAAARLQALPQGDGWRLADCTLVVTLEPCAMCAGAMMHARLSRVVFGAADPKTGTCGSIVNLFEQEKLNHHTELVGGVLAAECGQLLKDFFAERRAAQQKTAQLDGV